VTPAFLKQLYGVPSGLQVKNPASTQSVAEFLEQYFNPTDLTNYLAAMGVPAQTVANVIGPNNATEGSISGGGQCCALLCAAVRCCALLWLWLSSHSFCCCVVLGVNRGAIGYPSDYGYVTPPPTT
jgi:hypothetical protein